jgi:hypothetical protein
MRRRVLLAHLQQQGNTRWKGILEAGLLQDGRIPSCRAGRIVLKMATESPFCASEWNSFSVGPMSHLG